MSRTDALNIAAKYGIENEVKQLIDELGYEPIDALYQWDV